MKLSGQDRSNENHVSKYLCYPRNYIIFQNFFSGSTKCKKVWQWWGPQPMGSMCCGCSGQIHTDYRNPVEKNGWHSRSLSERGREGRRPWPLPGQDFIAFLGTLHRGWSSFTMHRFTVGDYLLQITKEIMLLITSKRRMLQIKGEGGWTGYTPYLGGLAQTLGI